MTSIDPEDSELVAVVCDIAEPRAREIVWLNDEGWHGTLEERWEAMRAWALSQLTVPA